MMKKTKRKSEYMLEEMLEWINKQDLVFDTSDLENDCKELLEAMAAERLCEDD